MRPDVPALAMFALFASACSGSDSAVAGSGSRGRADASPTFAGHDTTLNAPLTRRGAKGDPAGSSGPLEACTTDDDCAAGLCVLDRDGRVCAPACVDECPPGWSCLDLRDDGPDDTLHCVPEHATLCRPCRSAADCAQDLLRGASACVSHGDEGSFCATECGGERRPCPDGFECVTTGRASTCVPVEGACSCAASGVGYETDCVHHSREGSCGGSRSCGRDGLGPCVRAEDDAACVEVCSDGRTVREGYCAIAEACFPAGAANPDDVCSHCDPSSSSVGWTARPSAECDDGLPCTDDRCDPALDCQHTPRADVCLVDGVCVPPGPVEGAGGCSVCAEGGTVRSLSALPCGARDACGDGRHCSDGRCVLDVDPACPTGTQVAVPFGADGWSHRNAEGADQQFALPGFDDSGWPVGAGGFGYGYDGRQCSVTQTSPWDSYELDLRRIVDVPAEVREVEIGVSFDNDVKVWWNGVELTDGYLMAEGCAHEDREVFAVPRELVCAGPNVLALRARDRGGIRYIDASVRYTCPD